MIQVGDDEGERGRRAEPEVSGQDVQERQAVRSARDSHHIWCCRLQLRVCFQKGSQTWQQVHVADYSMGVNVERHGPESGYIISAAGVVHGVTRMV